MDASVETWNTWMGAWFAVHWTPADLPGLRHLIRLYDATVRGELQRAPELRLCMDTYGITPKGQQDRRWQAPEDEPVTEPKKTSGRYGHLKAVQG